MTEAGRWMSTPSQRAPRKFDVKYSHEGPDPSQAIPTSDFEWDEAAGMAAPKKQGGFSVTGPRGQSGTGPLETGELMALMMADKDEGSSYKLSTSRLSMLNKGNLTDEEREIISAGSY